MKRMIFILLVLLVAVMPWAGGGPAATIAAANITIISRTPAVNQLDVVASANIAVTFSDSINGSTVSSDTFNVDGSLSGKTAGTYNTSVATVTFNPTVNFRLGETITVTITTGIQSTGGGTLIAPVTYQFVVEALGGTGSFPSSTAIDYGSTTAGTMSVAFGDVDDDGDLDIVEGNYSPPSKVYKNDGTGTTWTGTSFGTGLNITSMALGDVDGDGDLDIVAGNNGGQNVVYKNDGTGTTWTGTNFGTGSDKAQAVALGDVDGDGDLDVVVGNNGQQNAVYKNDGTGSVWMKVAFGPGSTNKTRSIALGDVNGDGYLDIVLANRRDPNDVYLNDGSGSTWTPVNFGPASSLYDEALSVALGDVDSDGDLDIVETNLLGPNLVYKNDGTGTSWTGSDFYSGDRHLSSVVLGDVDGDGDLDIVAVSVLFNQHVVCKNDGTGTTWTATKFFYGRDAWTLAIGDVDSDSDLDVVVVGSSSVHNQIYKNGVLVPVEIRIEGNSIEIVNGDMTPSVTDYTDFGNVTVSVGTNDHYFVIKNIGDVPLTLSNVILSGTNAADFRIDSQPSFSTVVPGGQANFEVRFSPSALGIRSAIVSIANNDSDENPYTFAIQGTGIVAAPEIRVEGNSLLEIVNGDITPSTTDHTDFGSTPVSGGTVDRTFYISNVGYAALTLSGIPRVGLSGTNAADFSITVQPDSPVASGGRTNFKVRFAPSALGIRSATVSIANNDSDENPYTFAIQGTGIIATPEIRVEGNAIEIVSGDITPSTTDQTDFGSNPVTGGTADGAFVIRNTGYAALTLPGIPRVSLSGTNAADFSITIQPDSPVAAFDETTFKVRFDPSALGIRSATVSIANNDSDENPYTFAIQGTGTGIYVYPAEYRWSTVHTPKYKWDPYPTIFKGWQQVRLVNNGTGDVFNVKATITWAPANVTVTDGQVSFGTILAGSSKWSSDDFALVTDMSNPQNPKLGIIWKIEYDDAAGVHHVVENVPQLGGY